MKLNTEIVMTFIAVLSLVIAWLAYRVASLSRRESKPNIDVEWKIPIHFVLDFGGKRPKDLAYLIEGVFTNKGGTAVSTIELVPPEGGFVHFLKLAKGEKIEQLPFKPTPTFFLLSKPIQHYMTAETILKIKNEKLIKDLRGEVPLSIVIEPGHSSRFGMCYYFANYERPANPALNPIVSFIVRFNNGQTSGMNIAVGGVLTYA